MTPEPPATPTTTSAAPAHPPRRRLRQALPFLVSAILLGWIFSRIDVARAIAYLRLEVVLRFALPLVVFNFVTLAIEARCLARVAAESQASLSHGTAARIKAACYPLGILNFAVGGAGLSLLLRRRTGIGLAAAASMVVLIALFDIGAVLVWGGVGATLLQTDTLALRAGIVGGMAGAILSGFAFLRAPFDLGRLEWLREFDLLRAPRYASLGLLAELAVWRLVFCGCFVALVGALFQAFGIEVGAIELAAKVAIMLIVSAIPIAAGGLGTGQIVFVELFSGHAPDAQLLSASILFSLGMILVRATTGLVFAPEFTREAIAASTDSEPES